MIYKNYISNMKNNLKRFIRYLKENGYYRKYARNFCTVDGEKFRECSKLDWDVNNLDIYVTYPFDFSETKEGFNYWSECWVKWNDYNKK